MVMFFFFNDTATTEIYTLSLHDALPIYGASLICCARSCGDLSADQTISCDSAGLSRNCVRLRHSDRKSTRLNSSHSQISYAVFCLKKKKLDSPCAVPDHTSELPSPVYQV